MPLQGFVWVIRFILHPCDHTVIGLIVMQGPSDLILLPNIQIIEFAYS